MAHETLVASSSNCHLKESNTEGGHGRTDCSRRSQKGKGTGRGAGWLGRKGGTKAQSRRHCSSRAAVRAPKLHQGPGAGTASVALWWPCRHLPGQCRRPGSGPIRGSSLLSQILFLVICQREILKFPVTMCPLAHMQVQAKGPHRTALRFLGSWGCILSALYSKLK